MAFWISGLHVENEQALFVEVKNKRGVWVRSWLILKLKRPISHAKQGLIHLLELDITKVNRRKQRKLIGTGSKAALTQN